MAQIQINDYVPSAFDEKTERARIAEVLRQMRLSILALRKERDTMKVVINEQEVALKQLKGQVFKLENPA